MAQRSYVSKYIFKAVNRTPARRRVSRWAGWVAGCQGRTSQLVADRGVNALATTIIWPRTVRAPSVTSTVVALRALAAALRIWQDFGGVRESTDEIFTI
jgi:hypothetical protein